MEILTAAGTSTPKLAVDPATTATAAAKPQEERSRGHRSPPRILDAHPRASPLPKLRKTEACLDTPYAVQLRCTPAARTGNSTKCFKSLPCAPVPSVLFPPLPARSLSLG